MEIHCKGKSVGCYQDDTGFYVRMNLDGFPKQECEVPITSEQFYKLKFGNAVLTLEIE